MMKTVFTFLILFCMMTPNIAEAKGKYALVNGLNMYYEIHGDGYPLVLIHGGGSTIGTTFGRILPALAKTHKVIAVEMQAHGHTADIDRPLSFEQDADDIAELLQQLGIAKADIFGFSNGASTTLQVAIRHRQLVRKIVVASTFYNKEGAFTGFWDMMANANFEGMPQPYKEAFLQINPDKDALYRMYERDVARMQHFKEINEEDIKAIAVPALIIAGDKDVVTVEHAVKMYRMMQHAELAIFPGGHGDYMGELFTLKPGQTEYVALPVIEAFLKEE
jgi:pimeloyl-ACP methyl ester carboxylesterase